MDTEVDSDSPAAVDLTHLIAGCRRLRTALSAREAEIVIAETKARAIIDNCASERQKIARSTKPKPAWFAGLSRHSELLSSQPCDKFGKALLVGDFSELNDAREALSIPSHLSTPRGGRSLTH